MNKTELAKEYHQKIIEQNPATEAYDFESAFIAGFDASEKSKSIYVIWNKSYEWDDFESQDGIEYISTNLDSALAFFKKNYNKVKDISDEKWHYEYSLVEFPNGWSYCYNSNSKEIKTIITVSNSSESENNLEE